MVELARKMSTTLREFMDRTDDFFNAEDTLRVLIDPKRSKLEEVDQKAREIDKSVKRQGKFDMGGSDHVKRKKDKGLWD